MDLSNFNQCCLAASTDVFAEVKGGASPAPVHWQNAGRYRTSTMCWKDTVMGETPRRHSDAAI